MLLYRTVYVLLLYRIVYVLLLYRIVYFFVTDASGLPWLRLNFSAEPMALCNFPEGKDSFVSGGYRESDVHRL